MAALWMLQMTTLAKTKTISNNPLERLSTNSTAILPKQVDKTMPNEEYPMILETKSFLICVRVSIVLILNYKLKLRRLYSLKYDIYQVAI